MTAFWKNLHQLAHGQLFNGGYLTEKTAAQLAAKTNGTTCRKPGRTGVEQRGPAHPQIAAFR